MTLNIVFVVNIIWRIMAYCNRALHNHITGEPLNISRTSINDIQRTYIYIV